MSIVQPAHAVEIAERHPLDEMLKADRLPFIWCPGCGLGIVTKCLTESIIQSGIQTSKHVIVSGGGCSSPLLNCLNVQSYHTPQGSAMPFAIGLKTANPELEVTVVVCDSDLLSRGTNQLKKSAEANFDINVLCVNNSNYGRTGDQLLQDKGVWSSDRSRTMNSHDSSNLPYVVAASGAQFVSRWTTIHVRQLIKATRRIFHVQGFAFLEIISPCPPGFRESGLFEDGYAQMEYFRARSLVDDNADLSRIGLTMRPPEWIIVGNFVDKEKSSRNTLGTAIIDQKRPVKMIKSQIGLLDVSMCGLSLSTHLRKGVKP
jgi:2-oxoglutarate ferredoxin oxidoreductase subunit beta